MAQWEGELVVRRFGVRDVVAELGHALMRHVAGAIADEHGNLELLSALAFHPSVAVRAVVARADHLDDTAVAHLLDDSEPPVRQAIMWSAAARARITHGWLLAAIAHDATLAEDLLRDVDAFTQVDPPALVVALAGHADPLVRAAVARCRESGHPLLRCLCEDADPDVRLAAAGTLADW